jgi:ketosteroid isomerase-like protein
MSARPATKFREKAMSIRAFLICTCLLTGCVATQQRPDHAQLEQQVADAERAFAKTMADRDFGAFQSFLADEAVFFGSKGAIVGKQAVAEKWKSLYEGAQAPFSWKPDTAQVLQSGTLALTSGPVYDPAGKLSGTFTSIWRLESPGVWRIVFDKGCETCQQCPK